MGGGSLINSIAINTRIEEIKSSLQKHKTREKAEFLKILLFLSTPKIAFHNNGYFEKHYHICVPLSSVLTTLGGSDNCTCMQIDFIVEHLMIESDKLLKN